MSALVRNLNPMGQTTQGGHSLSLFIHSGTGVALVRNAKGEMVSCHPCVHQRELDIESMRKSGKWNQSDLSVRVGGFVYNLSVINLDTIEQQAARRNCQCGVCRPVNATLDRINNAVPEY